MKDIIIKWLCSFIGSVMGYAIVSYTVVRPLSKKLKETQAELASMRDAYDRIKDKVNHTEISLARVRKSVRALIPTVPQLELNTEEYDLEDS